MTLFCRGILPDETITEMMELRCYLDLVVSEHLDALLKFWAEMSGHSFNSADAMKLSYNANQLVTRLSVAKMTAERIQTAIRKRIEDGSV